MKHFMIVTSVLGQVLWIADKFIDFSPVFGAIAGLIIADWRNS